MGRLPYPVPRIVEDFPVNPPHKPPHPIYPTPEALASRPPGRGTQAGGCRGGGCGAPTPPPGVLPARSNLLRFFFMNAVPKIF